MKTKKQLESLGFVFITLGGGAVSASKIVKQNNGMFTIGANAKTMPTLRKRLEQVINDNPKIFSKNG